MINPDGVIVGNTRCNLAGADLNRQYKHAVKEAFPTVHHVKMLIAKLLEEDYSISIYCDLHAHSRKYNVFMYGCENRKRSQKYLMEQLFPLMLHKNAKNRFNFEDCRFTITRSKETTGRIVFWNMGITNSFTLEASYGGSNKGTKAYTHFNIRDYEQLGRYWCETLVDVFDPSPPNQQLRYKTIVKLMSEESCATDPCNIAMTDYSSLESSEGDYTDANSEEDKYFLFNNLRKIPRRRRRKIPQNQLKKSKEKKKVKFSKKSKFASKSKRWNTQARVRAVRVKMAVIILLAGFLQIPLKIHCFSEQKKLHNFFKKNLLQDFKSF